MNSRSPVVVSVVDRPAGGQRALDAAMARIHTHTGEVVGSGFLVEEGHILTCAHVVARALGREDWEAPAGTDTVSLDFPLVAAGVMVQARVAVWHPVQDDDRGDIAVLALVVDPPAGVLPAYLVAAETSGRTRFAPLAFPVAMTTVCGPRVFFGLGRPQAGCRWRAARLDTPSRPASAVLPFGTMS